MKVTQPYYLQKGLKFNYQIRGGSEKDKTQNFNIFLNE